MLAHHPLLGQPIQLQLEVGVLVHQLLEAVFPTPVLRVGDVVAGDLEDIVLVVLAEGFLGISVRQTIVIARSRLIL